MDIKVFSGEANIRLAQDIVGHLGISLRPVDFHHFPDGEHKVRYGESVRGKDIVLVQSLSPKPDTHLMQLLMMIDAAKRAGAKSLNIVIPYMCYMRQDGKEKPREPITARLVADLIQAAAQDVRYHVVTVEMHSKQQEGYFSSITPLYARLGTIDYFRKCLPVNNLAIVAPDANAAKQARAFAERLGDCPLAVIDKRRPEESKSEVINVIGDVAGKCVLLTDDMVDTAGTLCEATRAVLDRGATEVYAFCGHGLLSGRAPERIQKSRLKKIFVTDTIRQNSQNKRMSGNKIEVVSVAPLLAEAILRIHREDSISELFE